MKGPGLRVSMREADDEDRERTLRRHGFAASLVCLLRKDKFVDSDAADRSIVSAALCLLQMTPGDAVLQFDNPLLQRVGGRVRLNQPDDFWSNALVALINVPYEWADLS